MKKLITWTSLILAVSLFAEPGDNKGQLKKSMKVVPLSSIYLSTENGGTNHASAALSDGIGIYITQEDEYAKAIAYLNGKYGDDALKDDKSLKKYVLDNGAPADKELAEKLNLDPTPTQKPKVGDPCDDGKESTTGDFYVLEDNNFICKGVLTRNESKCFGDEIGSEFLVNGVYHLVVDNNTIKNKLDRAETLCTSNVTNMSELFRDNSEFNKDITHWDVSNVTIMNRMFQSALSFNQKIGNWDVSNVTDMNRMFQYTKLFDQPLNNWDISNVTDINRMFQFSEAFNQLLSSWNTSKVTDMYGFFYMATQFNQPIENWNISNVKDITGMFAHTKFNQPLNKWDVSNVKVMQSVFYGSTEFNQPLNNWNVSNVTNMLTMFYGAKKFNQPIGNWDTNNAISYANFAIDSALTKANAPSKNGTKFPTTQP